MYTKQPSPCGTVNAYVRHLNHGQVPCQPCKDASRLYHSQRNERRKQEKERLKAAQFAAMMHFMEGLTIARNKEREKFATQVQELG